MPRCEPQLPQGAGPISFQSDFGDTAALMLTIASPKADAVEIGVRSQSIESAIRHVRELKKKNTQRKPVTVIYSFPQSISPRAILDGARLFQEEAQNAGVIRDSEIIQGSGFVGLDGDSSSDDISISTFIENFFSEQLKRSELHPDAWDPIVIREPAETREKLAKGCR